MGGEERRCKRCGDEEFRIDGYCTEYCKDIHAVERERDAMRSLYQEAMDRLGQACHDAQKYKAKHHWYKTAFSEMAERVAGAERSWPEEEEGSGDER